MTTTRNVIDALANGNLGQASSDLEAVLQQKRGAEWENAKLNLAHTAFDDVTPQVTDAGNPVDTGISGDPAEVEEK
jgi:outer membrane protein assembly factor BamD (BamD/ComL family)